MKKKNYTDAPGTGANESTPEAAGEPKALARTGDAAESSEEAEFPASDAAESGGEVDDPAGKAAGPEGESAQEPDMDACIRAIQEASRKLGKIRSKADKKWRVLKVEMDRLGEEHSKASVLLALARTKSASAAAAEMEMDPKTLRSWARRFYEGRRKGLGPKDCLALDGRRRPAKGDDEAAKIVEAIVAGEGDKAKPLTDRIAEWLDEIAGTSREGEARLDWRLYPLSQVVEIFFKGFPEGHGEDVEMRDASQATVRRAIKRTRWPYPIRRGDLLLLCAFRGCAPGDYEVRRWWRSGPEVQEAIKEARKRAYEAKASAVPKTLLKPASAEVVPEPASGESSAPFEESPLDKAVDPAVEAPGDTASASASAEPAPEGGAES